jgi:hypothetical protein
MHTYTAKTISEIDNGPKRWKYINVGIFRIEDGKEEQIGEYIRNYPTLFDSFCHFVKNDKNYALYSTNYTATRVMELPSCKDIGGEEPNSWGFCPVDYFVPRYIELESIFPDGKVMRHRVNEPSAEVLHPTISGKIHTQPVSPLLYYSFGFVEGCVWGDDSSMKIQYLDLSNVENGIIKREERFGYIAKPDGLKLKQAVDMIDYLYDPDEENAYYVTIAIQKRFDLRTGKPVD